MFKLKLSLYKLILFVGLMALLVPLTAVLATAPVSPLPQEIAIKVDPALLAEIEAQGRATFIVEFSARADLSPAYAIKDWDARGRFVWNALVKTAEASQAGVVAVIQDRIATGAARDMRRFYSSNSLEITTDGETLAAIAARPEVKWVRKPVVVPAPKPIRTKSIMPHVPYTAEWGIHMIRADAVWSTFGRRGEGIVVANMDSGVEYTHPALVHQYRGNNGDGTFTHDYNWFDPTGYSPSTPVDSDGHGTHTMGTMVGDDGAGNQIGVAPRARWIAAKICDVYCEEGDILAAADWMLAPTPIGVNPGPGVGDPSRRPHVVNNSWGSCEFDDFMRPSLQAWRASGIFSSWSAGNTSNCNYSAPFCGSIGEPATLVEALGVGATTSSDDIAYFSLWGPSQDPLGGGEIKPEVSAPGQQIRSSVPGGYDTYSGTSMAAPHVSGAVALLLSAAPHLIGNVDGIEETLINTAEPKSYDTGCGNEGPGNVPNNAFGYGRIDVFKAVTLAATGMGYLNGTVTEAAALTAAGDPLAKVTVVATGLINAETTTDASGYYTMTLPEGNYDVTYRRYGYDTVSLTGVTIVTDVVTTQDVAMAPLPTYTVSGTVTDAITSAPIAGATVAVPGTPLPPATTNASGFYSLSGLVAGPATLRVSAVGYGTVQRSISVTGDMTEDFSLIPELTYSCTSVPLAIPDSDPAGVS
ncbi:MAG TPA: peptidase S8, partial [Anaerolineae bacterium]|nr:peptidase S8 [Anaerolineae bacterium]